jgi:hypothetical protein
MKSSSKDEWWTPSDKKSSKVDPALTLTPELISQVERTEVKRYDIDKMIKTGSDIWSDKWPYTGFST